LLLQLERDTCSSRDLQLLDKYKYSADKKSICNLQVVEHGLGWRCASGCCADGCAAIGDPKLDGMASRFALGQKRNLKAFLDSIKAYDKLALALVVRKRNEEKKTQRKQADADAADAPAAGGGSAPPAQATGQEYQNQRLARIAANNEEVARLDMEHERQQLRQIKEGQTAVSAKVKPTHVAATAAGAEMTTRLTAATKKQAAAAPSGALHAAEVAGSEFAAAPAPNANAKPNADAESEADAEAKAAAESKAAGAFDAAVSKKFQVQACEVVRSKAPLLGMEFRMQPCVVGA
jgi:hypothetical protein